MFLIKDGKLMTTEIRKLAKEIEDLNINAYNAYYPIIQDLLTRVATEKDVEYVMDRYINFCGYDKNLDLFNEVCNTYQEIYPEMINFQREQLKELFN